MDIETIIKNTKTHAFLIGAGVSASSGIPTFRGKEGYWTIGSKEYRPEEMATYANYSKNRHSVWSWYKHRRELIQSVTPNISHKILNELINNGDTYVINQNVDGFINGGIDVHGNIHQCRCEECNQLFEIDDVPNMDICPLCNGTESLRPNILLFDERYNVSLLNNALDKASIADTIFIIGTSNKCNITNLVLENTEAIIVEVNLEKTIKSNLFLCMESDEFMTYYKTLK